MRYLYWLGWCFSSGGLIGAWGYWLGDKTVAVLAMLAICSLNALVSTYISEKQ